MSGVLPKKRSRQRKKHFLKKSQKSRFPYAGKIPYPHVPHTQMPRGGTRRSVGPWAGVGQGRSNRVKPMPLARKSGNLCNKLIMKHLQETDPRPVKVSQSESNQSHSLDGGLAPVTIHRRSQMQVLWTK
jgi:hypothetical protein